MILFVVSGLPSAFVIRNNLSWIQNGVTVAGCHTNGAQSHQLNNAYGIFIDDDETIYVADTGNHRIVEWTKGAAKGKVVAGGNGKGNRNDQLSSPKNVVLDRQNNCLIICDSGNKRVVRWYHRRDLHGEILLSNIECYGVALDHDGYLYVSDIGNHQIVRCQIADKVSTVVAGGHGKGNRLDQLGLPYYIFVDQDRSIYVSDAANHRVMKWIKGAKEGILVAGDQEPGNSLTQFDCPRGIVVDHSGAVYIADDNNHRIMRWSQGSKQGSVVAGGNGKGKKDNQISGPTGLAIDSHGNLYVIDFDNDRVQKFLVNSS